MRSRISYNISKIVNYNKERKFYDMLVLLQHLNRLKNKSIISKNVNVSIEWNWIIVSLFLIGNVII